MLQGRMHLDDVALVPSLVEHLVGRTRAPFAAAEVAGGVGVGGGR